MLLAAYRRLEAAAVPLIPIALATGWSSLLLFVLQIPLNPMSATLGALVIAISTEFAVMLSARYRAERAPGLEPVPALARTYRAHGAAVLASGVTRSPGFAALLVSGFPMLRDFGAVTVVNLSVSLLGVMVVLPAALVWAEQRGPLRAAALARRVRRAARGAGGRAVRAGAGALGRAVRGTPGCTAQDRRSRAPRRTISQVTAHGPRSPLRRRQEREAEAEKARSAARPYSVAVGVSVPGADRVRRHQRL